MGEEFENECIGKCDALRDNTRNFKCVWLCYSLIGERIEKEGKYCLILFSYFPLSGVISDFQVYRRNKKNQEHYYATLTYRI